jgi:hypothetical protein
MRTAKTRNDVMMAQDLHPNHIPAGVEVEVIREVKHRDFYSGTGYLILWHRKMYSVVVDPSVLQDIQPEEEDSNLEAQINLKKTWQKEAEHWKKEEKYYRERYNVQLSENTHRTKEIDRLADFLLQEFPDEIGLGDPVSGESAVDVAIRLLRRLK